MKSNFIALLYIIANQLISLGTLLTTFIGMKTGKSYKKSYYLHHNFQFIQFPLVSLEIKIVGVCDFEVSTIAFLDTFVLI